jgi:MFS family permease
VLTVLAMVGTAVMIALFGQVPANYTLLCATAVAVGFCMFGGIVCLYASCTRVFPAAVRATGTGVVIGLGRFGGMLGPAMGGLLLQAGFDRATVALTMGCSAVLAAVSMATLPAKVMAAPTRHFKASETNSAAGAS